MIAPLIMIWRVCNSVIAPLIMIWKCVIECDSSFNNDMDSECVIEDCSFNDMDSECIIECDSLFNNDMDSV